MTRKASETTIMKIVRRVWGRRGFTKGGRPRMSMLRTLSLSDAPTIRAGAKAFMQKLRRKK